MKPIYEQKFKEEIYQMLEAEIIEPIEECCGWEIPPTD
jgi:hypothetical protein